MKNNSDINPDKENEGEKWEMDAIQKHMDECKPWCEFVLENEKLFERWDVSNCLFCGKYIGNFQGHKNVMQLEDPNLDPEMKIKIPNFDEEGEVEYYLSDCKEIFPNTTQKEDWVKQSPSSPRDLRNPKRIKKILRRIKKVWKKFPQQRLGQILVNHFHFDLNNLVHQSDVKLNENVWCGISNKTEKKPIKSEKEDLFDILKDLHLLNLYQKLEEFRKLNENLPSFSPTDLLEESTKFFILLRNEISSKYPHYQKTNPTPNDYWIYEDTTLLSYHLDQIQQYHIPQMKKLIMRIEENNNVQEKANKKKNKN